MIFNPAIAWLICLGCSPRFTLSPISESFTDSRETGIDGLSPSLDLSHHAIRTFLDVALSTPEGLPYVEEILLTTLISLRSVMEMKPQVAYQLAMAVLGGASSWRSLRWLLP